MERGNDASDYNTKQPKTKNKPPKNPYPPCNHADAKVETKVLNLITKNL